MTEIAKITGHSKSAIGRHSLNCLARTRMDAIRSKRFNPRRDRVIFERPDGTYLIVHDPEQRRTSCGTLAQPELSPGDTIITILFRAADVKNPAALTNQPA